MPFVLVAQILTYLGTLPFLYALLAAFNAAPFVTLLPFTVSDALMGYAVVILSFIAGIHWGLALSQSAAPNINVRLNTVTVKLLISSNVLALWAWAMFLQFHWAAIDQAWWFQSLSFVGLALGFAGLVWLDYRWLNLANTHPWFWRLRWHASSVAVVALLAQVFA